MDKPEDEHFKKLKALDALGDSLPRWVIIVEVLNSLERLGPVDNAGIPWIDRVVDEISKKDETKAGANQVRKLQRTLRFVRSAQEEPELKSLPIKHYYDIGSSTLEVISRLWKIDRQMAINLLKSNCKKYKSYEYVKKIYKEQSNLIKEANLPRSVKYSKSDEFNSVIEKAIIEKRGALIPIYKSLSISRNKKQEGMRANVDIVMTLESENGEKWYEGIRICLLKSDVNKRQWSRKIPEIAFHSTFFRRFWVIVIGELSIAQCVHDEIQAYELNNTGVIAIDGNWKISFCSAGTQDPIPNREKLLDRDSRVSPRLSTGGKWSTNKAWLDQKKK